MFHCSTAIELEDSMSKLMEELIKTPITILPEVTEGTTSDDVPTVYILYHFPCKDGFGAAWSHMHAVLKHRAAGGVAAAKYVYLPENHRWGQTLKLMEDPKISTAHVLYLDICPKRELLMALNDKAKLVRVYDHHKSAQEDCGDLPYCFFDMNRSGAGISWDIFCDSKRPRLIDTIEDGDLWRWKLPNSQEILIVLETTRFDFNGWTKFSNELETNPSGIINKGKAYVEYRNIVTRMLGGRKIHKLKFHLGDKTLTMPALNASIFQSGLGNQLTNKPGPCGAVYYFNGEYWAFSLRSNDEGPDVSEIAKYFGGGGHRNASGFRLDALDLPGDISPEAYSEEELAEMAEEWDVDWVLPFTLGVHEKTQTQELNRPPDVTYH